MSGRFAAIIIFVLVLMIGTIYIASMIFGWWGGIPAAFCWAQALLGSSGQVGATNSNPVGQDEGSIHGNRLMSSSSPRADHFSLHEYASDSWHSGPTVNIDGTPMVGPVDINGCPYGVTYDSLHSSDSFSSISSDSFSSMDSFSSSSGSMFD